MTIFALISDSSPTGATSVCAGCVPSAGSGSWRSRCNHIAPITVQRIASQVKPRRAEKPEDETLCGKVGGCM